MIPKEANTFTADVDMHRLKIHLKDQAPIQKNYNFIPKPIYKELDKYIEDLLNRG